LAVADDGERGEAEAAATLHDLGATIDEDDLLDHRRAVGRVRILLVATIAARATTVTARATVRAAVELPPLAALRLFGRGGFGCSRRDLRGGGRRRFGRGTGFGAHAVVFRI